MKMVSFRKALTGATEWIVDANIKGKYFFGFHYLRLSSLPIENVKQKKNIIFYFYSFLIDFYSLNEKKCVLLPNFGFIGELNLQVKC